MNPKKTKKPNIVRFLTAIGGALVCLLGCWLSFSASIIPSVSLEQELRCGIQAHSHTDACYTGEILSCTTTAHAHDGNCYILLLQENNINHLLTLMEQNENCSLDSLIGNVMAGALNLNENLRTPSDAALTKPELEAFNETIEKEEALPDLTLNENLTTSPIMEEMDSTGENKDETLSEEQGQESSNEQEEAQKEPLAPEERPPAAMLAGVNSSASSANYSANIYIRLDGAWNCIGTLTYSRSGSSRYTLTLPTDSLLSLLNDTLKTGYTYSDIDISIATSVNGTYSKPTGTGVGQTTTTLATNQSSTNSRRARYIRILADGADANSTSFAFYTVTLQYPDGTKDIQYLPAGAEVILPDGYKWYVGDTAYRAGEKVAINSATTFIGEPPVTQVFLKYDVAFPNISNVTITAKPTLAGRTETVLTDEFTENSSVVLRNLSNQSVRAFYNWSNTGQSQIVQFRGWRVNDSEIILQPNTTLIWEELLNYERRGIIELTAVWDYDVLQTASFYVRFDSVAVDTEGNVTGQDSEKYTDELFAAYVGNVDPSLGYDALNNTYHLVDEKPDNSFTVDQKIRALYGERTSGVWLSAFPTDEFVFSSLVEYANTGYLSVDGETVKAEDLNDREYAIRWYVFKCQSDAWHIDGRLVKKHGLIHVYKTFAGNKALVADAKSDFYITADDITAGTQTRLDLQNKTSYDEATDTYMWEIKDVDYGEEWVITEHPHQFTDPSVDFYVHSEYTVMDSHGDQSISGTGTSLSVTGMTYALDEGTDEVLRAEFTNIYNRSDSLLIKKQDSRTGVSIGGATFSLLQNGKVLRFNYDTATGRYIYDPAGSETILSGNANGYFEIAIEDFSYDIGPITVREVSPPTGYTPIGDIQIGYGADNTLGILSGNSELIQYLGGVLIIGNSTESSSVTVEKKWDCPESEWREVEVQLLANGRLVTTVIAGVAPSAVLSETNSWRNTWENLPVYVNGEKISWSTREIRIGQELHKEDYSFVNWLVSYDLPIHSVDAEGNENILLGITNTTKRVMLRLTKTDFSWSSPLQGAVFRLVAVDAAGAPLADEVIKTAETGESGTLTFDNLKCGIRYCLIETAPPKGYHQIPENIYFIIQEDGSLAIEENYYAKAGATAYNLLVRNAEAIPLPESGGAGIGMFYTLGLLLCGLALGIYIKTFRKGRCFD